MNFFNFLLLLIAIISMIMPDDQLKRVKLYRSDSNSSNSIMTNPDN